jgi:1,4-dihydroxy-2-naphthoyl-CoA hydrolase
MMGLRGDREIRKITVYCLLMSYQRTIRLADTDAAGVVYFAHLLSICHEAYEDALEQAGISLRTVIESQTAILPIVHGEIDFYQPLFCGDRIIIHLQPQLISPHRFEITYQIYRSDTPSQSCAIAKTRHVCIHPETRQRKALSNSIQQWIDRINPEFSPEIPNH